MGRWKEKGNNGGRVKDGGCSKEGRLSHRPLNCSRKKKSVKTEKETDRTKHKCRQTGIQTNDF